MIITIAHVAFIVLATVVVIGLICLPFTKSNKNV